MALNKTSKNGMQWESTEWVFGTVIFPNPVTNELSVVHSPALEIKSWEIVDFSGRVIKIGNSISKHQTISTGDLHNGMYILAMLLETGEVVSKRFVVQHE